MEVFELLAWTTDPVAIPLRVWLMVLDVDRSGHASPRVVIHRLRPMEPRRGMVYEVLIHVLSVEIQGGLGRTVGRCSTLSISISVFRTPIKRWCRRRGLESKKLSWRLTQLGIGCLLGTPARLSTGGRTAAPTGKTTKMKQATVAAPPRRSGEACSSVSGGWPTKGALENAHLGASALKARGKVAALPTLRAQPPSSRGSTPLIDCCTGFGGVTQDERRGVRQGLPQCQIASLCRRHPVAAATPAETEWQCLHRLNPLMRWTSS